MEVIAVVIVDVFNFIFILVHFSRESCDRFRENRGASCRLYEPVIQKKKYEIEKLGRTKGIQETQVIAS